MIMEEMKVNATVVSAALLITKTPSASHLYAFLMGCFLRKHDDEEHKEVELGPPE